MTYHLAVHPFAALCENTLNTTAGAKTNDMAIVDCPDRILIIDDIAEKASIARSRQQG